MANQNEDKDAFDFLFEDFDVGEDFSFMQPQYPSQTGQSEGAGTQREERYSPFGFESGVQLSEELSANSSHPFHYDIIPNTSAAQNSSTRQRRTERQVPPSRLNRTHRRQDRQVGNGGNVASLPPSRSMINFTDLPSVELKDPNFRNLRNDLSRNQHGQRQRQPHRSHVPGYEDIGIDGEGGGEVDVKYGVAPKFTAPSSAEPLSLSGSMRHTQRATSFAHLPSASNQADSFTGRGPVDPFFHVSERGGSGFGFFGSSTGRGEYDSKSGRVESNGRGDPGAGKARVSMRRVASATLSGSSFAGGEGFGLSRVRAQRQVQNRGGHENNAKVKLEGPASPLEDKERDRGSKEDVEEKRQRRLARNRESARQSRRRKKEQLESIEQQVIELTYELDAQRREFLRSYFRKKEAKKIHFLKNLNMTLKPTLAAAEEGESAEVVERLSEYEEIFGLTNKLDSEIFSYHFLHAFDLLFPSHMKYFLYIINNCSAEITTKKKNAPQGQLSTHGSLNSVTVMNTVSRMKSEDYYGDYGDYNGVSASLWDKFCRELNLSMAQREKLKTDLKSQYSLSATTEQTRLANVISFFKNLQKTFERNTKAVEAQTKAICEILTPQQIANFLLFFEETIQAHEGGEKEGEEVGVEGEDSEEKGVEDSDESEDVEKIVELIEENNIDIDSNTRKALEILQKKDDEIVFDDLQLLLSIISRV